MHKHTQRTCAGADLVREAMQAKKKKAPTYRCCCDYECMHVGEFPADLIFFVLKNCCLGCCTGYHCCTLSVMLVRYLIGILVSLAAFYYAAYFYMEGTARWTAIIISAIVVFIGLIGFLAYTRAFVVSPKDYRGRHKFGIVVKLLEIVLAAGTMFILFYIGWPVSVFTYLQLVVCGLDLVLNPIEVVVTIVILKNMGRVSDAENN